MTAKSISIRGAREHNLKNVSLDLPRDSLFLVRYLRHTATALHPFPSPHYFYPLHGFHIICGHCVTNISK